MSGVFERLCRELAGDGAAAYRIGLPIDTGPHGIDLLAGAAVAIAKHRAQGLSVSAHWADDGRQPGPAREAASHLLSQGMRLAIGHFASAAAAAAAPLYAEAGGLLVLPGSSDPDLTAGGSSLLFRVCGRDEEQAEMLAEVLGQHAPAGIPPVILSQASHHGRSLASRLERRLRERGLPLRHYTAARPELVLPGGPVPRGPTAVIGTVRFAAGMLPRVSPHELRLVSDDGYCDALIETAAESAEGVEVAVLDASPAAQTTDDLAGAYRRRAPGTPGAYFLTSYTATEILLRAIALSGSGEPTTLARVLRMRSWQTLFGPLRFDDKGEVDGINWGLRRVTSGEFVRSRHETQL